MTELTPAAREAVQFKSKSLKEIGIRKGLSGRELKRWFDRHIKAWAKKRFKKPV